MAIAEAPGGPRLRVHVTGEQTGGRFALLELTVAQGEEFPCHLHQREDEMLYVLSGALSVYLDGKGFAVGAGQMMYLPCGVEHAFIVASEEARLLTLLAPAGCEGLYRDMDDDVLRRDVEWLITRAAHYGCEITGPLSDLPAL